MKQKIHQFDFALAEVPKYSHREACEVLGYTSNALQLINKRGFAVPVRIFSDPAAAGDAESQGPRKRGKGRRYSAADLVYLGLFKAISQYREQMEAARIAINAVPLVLTQFWAMWAAESGDEMAQTDQGAYLVFFDFDGMPAVQLIGPKSADPGASLSDWIRAMGLESVAVVSLYSIAVRIFGGIASVKSGPETRRLNTK